jgi:hypothetical protein
MKASIGAILTAAVASACCIGPVAFAAIGSGALAAASTKLGSVRPAFLGLTIALMGLAFYRTYRNPADTCRREGTCAPDANRKARILDESCNRSCENGHTSGGPFARRVMPRSL